MNDKKPANRPTKQDRPTVEVEVVAENPKATLPTLDALLRTFFDR